MDSASFGAMIPIGWYGRFWVVETSYGTEFLDGELIGDEPVLDDFTDYVDGEPESFESREGWGCYLSMPGYMDRTDLSVFDTELQAIEYLLEQGGE